MSDSFRRFSWVAAIVVAVVGGGGTAWTQGQRSATPAASAGAMDSSDEDLWSALTPLDRQILELVSESQLEELLNGTDPSDIFLSNGETLSELTARTQAASSRNLLFAPVEPCRLLDTRLTAEGSMRPGETRGFRIRMLENGYEAQGGAPGGCGLPGPDGVTLKTNTVRAIALNILTVDVGGPGSLAIWPANRSEPEIGSVSFAAALAGGGVTGGLLVPVCDEASLEPCGGGDLKIKAKMSGTHVVADVVGYFHSVEPSGWIQASEAARESTAPDRESTTTVQPAGSAASAALSPPPAVPSPASQLGSLPADRSRRTSEIPFEPPQGGIPEWVSGFIENSTFVAQLNTGHGGGGGVIDLYMENDGEYFNASGAKIFANTGNGVWANAPNGRGLFGQTRDGYAVYGFDGGSVPNLGYAGYFYSTNGIGVYGYSNADRTHPNILAPGIYGQSNRGIGVYGRGDTANTSNFYNEGGYFEGGRGLYARGTDAEFEGGSSLSGYGARFYSNNYRALYAIGDSDDYDAHFDGGVGIIVDGIVLAPAVHSIVVNRGTRPIEPGDLVAVVGVVPTNDEGPPRLAVAGVDAGNRHAVVGVAQSAHTVRVVKEDGARPRTEIVRVEGSAAPGSHLTIVTQGLAPAVRPTSLTQAANWRVGDRIGLSSGGAMELAESAQDAVTIGKVASPPDPTTGTIALFVDID